MCGQLKRRLAAAHGADRCAYTQAKAEFVEHVLATASGDTFQHPCRESGEASPREARAVRVGR
jgi:hypothetical protein